MFFLLCIFIVSIIKLVYAILSFIIFRLFNFFSIFIIISSFVVPLLHSFMYFLLLFISFSIFPIYLFHFSWSCFIFPSFLLRFVFFHNPRSILYILLSFFITFQDFFIYTFSSFRSRFAGLRHSLVLPF